MLIINIFIFAAVPWRHCERPESRKTSRNEINVESVTLNKMNLLLSKEISMADELVQQEHVELGMGAGETRVRCGR
jgi:hypothetical protein